MVPGAPCPDEHARRVVTAVTLCLFADAIRDRIPEPGVTRTPAELARTLQYAALETQVRTGTRLPLLVA